MSNVIEDTVAINVVVKSDGTRVVTNLQDKIKVSTSKIKDNFKSVNTTIKNCLKTLATFAASAVLITSVSGAVRNLTRDSIEFNREFTQVRTLLDETQINVAGMEQKILAMGGALGDVLNITRGTYQMISSGQDAESALQKIGDAARFAQGGQVLLRDAVSVGTVYLNAYGEAAGGLSHVYDVLWQTIKDGVTTAPELAHAMGRVVPIARAAGLTIEEVSGSIAVMTQISQNTNESVTALRGILSSIVKPSAEAAKEAERLGINFSMAGIQSMGFSNWLADLLEKVKQGDGDIALLFGQVEALNGVFQLSRNNLENFKNEMVKMSAVTGNNEESFRKYKESFQGAWETMKNKLQAIFVQNILPLLKDVASWISQNSENISRFVEGAISGFKTVVGIIGKFKDVIIMAGKAWAAYFAISKINAVFKAFVAGEGVLSQVVVGFVNLKKYGLSAMDALKGSWRTATGEAFSLGDAVKKIPTSVKITVALIGAQLVGQALAKLFDLISDYHDRGMAKIIEETERTTGVTGKLNREIAQFVQIGKNQQRVVEDIKKTLEYYGYTTKDSTQYVKRLHDLLGQSKEWKEWQNNLLNAGAGVKSLSISLSENQQVYKDLAKSVGNFTETELSSLIQQGIITETQKGKLLELQATYKEHQKVIEEQRKKIDDLASSMGILTQQGYVEQSEKIKDLLSVYSQYKTQIYTNADTLKTWVDKIDELSKTALPGEKEALEKIREEMILGYGEYNKSIVSIGAYEQEVNKALSSLFPFTGAIFENKDALYAQSLIMVGIATNNLPLLMKAWDMMGLKMTGTGKETKNVNKKTNELTNTFSELSQTINTAFDALSSFGINLGGLENIFKGVSSGLNSIGSGLNAIDQAGKGLTGFLQRASGYINMFSGAVSAGVSILKGFIDILSGKSGELEAAERRLSGLSGVTGDWAEKIETLAKQLGGAESTERAFNAMLADIIRNTQITVSNFSQFITKTREIISVFERGNATAEETARNFGAAFSEMAKAASQLGLEGGKEMTGLIMLADEFGLKVREIQEYLEQNKSTAVEGYRSFLEAAFSDIRIGVLDEWVAFEDKVKAKQTLVDGIQGISDSLIGLSNTTRLTKEQYSQFQAAANDAYNSLITQGFTSNEALQVMQPMLERLAFLQGQFGYQVDDTTGALIKQGIEAGLISEDMKTENQLMLEGFDRIVDRLNMIAIGLGVKIPEALGSMETASMSALSSIQNHTGTWSGQLDTIYGQFGDLQDASCRLNSTYDDIMVGHSLIPLTQLWIDTLGRVETTLFTIGDTMKVLDYEYTVLISNMGDQTERFAMNAQGQIRTLLNQLALIGKETAGQIGSRYGVYTDEQKQGMTAEFFQMSHLWQDSRATILSSEESMRRFLQDVESLVVIDEAKDIYDKFLKSMNQWYGNLARGRTWDEATKTWIDPVSAARGIQFVVPPGFDDEKYGFPMYVHSGELVQVYPRDETNRILGDDLSRYGKVGTDSFTPTPYAIPQQTLYDFYRPPDDLFAPEGAGDVEIQLNDGVAPVYVPGQSEKKIEINLNVNFSPIHITVEVEGNRDGTDDDELSEKITEKLRDNVRGFQEELVERLKTELKKELDL